MSLKDDLRMEWRNFKQVFVSNKFFFICFSLRRELEIFKVQTTNWYNSGHIQLTFASVARVWIADFFPAIPRWHVNKACKILVIRK